MNEIHVDDQVSASENIVITRTGAGFGNESGRKHKIHRGTVGTVERVSGVNPHRVFDVRFGGRLASGLRFVQIEKVQAV